MYKPASWVCLGLVLFLQWPVSAFAAAPVAATAGKPMTGSGQEEQEQEKEQGEEIATDAGQEEDSMLDRHKRFMDSQAQRASRWADGFFADPNYEAESLDSQFRLRPELYYRDEQGAQLKMKVLAKIQLPNLGHRVSLVVGADEDDDRFSRSDNDSEQNRMAGLQFFLSGSEKWNASILAGFKSNDSAFFLGPRLRYQTPINDMTSIRLTQTFRWLTSNNWDIGSKADLNFALSNHFFYRQTVYGRWRGERSDEDGYSIQVSSVLSQRLSHVTGLQYEFSTIFHTRPDTHVDKYILSLRYRKQTRRDWLYYEIAPEVAFEDEFDFKTNPGIRFRLEFFYGGSKTSRFWQHESEDSEEFRW